MYVVKKYFSKISKLKREMEKSLGKYKQATEDFYTITGVRYSNEPKGTGKPLGFDDLLGNIEELYNDYVSDKEEYDEEYKRCMLDINKLDQEVYKLIIEYSEIDGKEDKEILKIFKKYHNIDYSLGYFRNLKNKARNEFKEIIK